MNFLFLVVNISTSVTTNEEEHLALKTTVSIDDYQLSIAEHLSMNSECAKEYCDVSIL